MNGGDLRSSENRALELRVSYLRRERSVLLALLILTIAFAVLDRVGSRVYAIAVRDSASNALVEVAYLAQKEQTERVEAGLLERARQAHPVYRGAKDLYSRSNPGFEEPLLIRQVRRVTPLLATRGAVAVDLPVQDATEKLAEVVRVVLDAWGIYDEEVGKERPLVVLPTEAMAKQALKTRLENVALKVKADLRGTSRLVGEPAFLQSLAIRQVRWPVAEVRTVQQAVDYLTRGDVQGSLHVKQAGETLGSIAAKYGATVADLGAWNGGLDLKLLRVGDKLVVRRPEPPVTVLTVERRSYVEIANRDGRSVREKVTVEIRRHDGVDRSRREVSREPVS